jgi:hypothetical protein
MSKELIQEITGLPAEKIVELERSMKMNPKNNPGISD